MKKLNSNIMKRKPANRKIGSRCALVFGALLMTVITLVGMNPTGQFIISQAGDTFANIATVANTDSYTDLINKPTIPSTTRTTSSLALSLVGTGATGTQISATKDSTIRCSVSTSTTSTIGGPSTSLVTLKICATNNGTEASWTSIATLENDQTITLAIIINSMQIIKGQLSSDVPAGWYAKLVNSGTGTHSETSIGGQQTIYG